MNVNLIGILTLLLTAVNLAITLVVLHKSYKKVTSWVYAGVIFSVALWSIATFFYNSDIIFTQLVWLKVIYILSYVMVLAQIAFTYLFPRRIDEKFWQYVLVIFLTMIPSAYYLIFTDSVIVSVEHLSDRFLTIADMGSGYIIYIIPNTLAVILLSYYFFKKSKRFVGVEKAQIKLYIIASLCMYVPILFIDYVIPLVTGYTGLYRLGPLFVTPFTIIVAYSMVKTRFLGLRTVIGRIIDFILITLFIFSGFYLFQYLYVLFFGSIYNKSALTVSIIIAPIVTYILTKFQHLVKEAIVKRFIYGGIGPDEEVARFTKRISIELDPNIITDYLFKVLKKVLDVDRLGLILFNDDARDYEDNPTIKRYQGLRISDNEAEILMNYWQVVSGNVVLFIDELKRREKSKYPIIKRKFERVMDIMENNHVYGIIPISSKTKLRGLVLIGRKIGEEAFTVEDIDLIEEIIANTSVALGRAVLYEEVQKFSETLQQKVEKATEELRKQKTQLEETLRKERDMMDILGHELRTPLAVIRNGLAIVKMNLGKDLGKVEEWLEKSKEALMNEINIVDTVLASSRIAGERVEVRHEEVDLNKVIQKVFSDFETKAKSKGLYLQYEPIESSKIYADKGKVRQIYTNLVSNAVKYTNEGGLKVRVYEKDNMLCTEFKDTGVGISREDLVNLGKKFYRAKQYLNDDDKEAKLVRPGGTGLGLYISINLVRMMGGELRFDSELGKGSVFTVCLPKYSGQEVRIEEGGQKEVNKVKEKSKDAFERLGLKK